jgi:hypothetical protein
MRKQRLEFYARNMPVYVWAPIALAVVAAAAWTWWLFRAKAQTDQTNAAKLERAAKAAEALRRAGPRANRDAFERGQRPRTRYAGPLAKNVALGDAADVAGDSSD